MLERQADWLGQHRWQPVVKTSIDPGRTAPEVHRDRHAAVSRAAPHNGIGAVIAGKSDADAAVRALQNAGFSSEDISLFAGREGLHLNLKVRSMV